MTVTPADWDMPRSLTRKEVEEARTCILALINSWVAFPRTTTDAEVARRLGVSEPLIQWARAGVKP
jgi:hypothetical protein